MNSFLEDVEGSKCTPHSHLRAEEATSAIIISWRGEHEFIDLVILSHSRLHKAQVSQTCGGAHLPAHRADPAVTNLLLRNSRLVGVLDSFSA